MKYDPDRAAELRNLMEENQHQQAILTIEYTVLYQEWYTLWAQRDQEAMQTWRNAA